MAHRARKVSSFSLILHGPYHSHQPLRLTQAVPLLRSGGEALDSSCPSPKHHCGKPALLLRTCKPLCTAPAKKANARRLPCPVPHVILSTLSRSHTRSQPHALQAFKPSLPKQAEFVLHTVTSRAGCGEVPPARRCSRAFKRDCLIPRALQQLQLCMPLCQGRESKSFSCSMP